MNFRKINMDVWDRRECFEHFSTVAKSTYSIPVDVEEMLRRPELFLKK